MHTPHTHTHTHTHTHARAHVHTHTCIHTSTHLLSVSPCNTCQARWPDSQTHTTAHPPQPPQTELDSLTQTDSGGAGQTLGSDGRGLMVRLADCHVLLNHAHSPFAVTAPGRKYLAGTLLGTLINLLLSLLGPSVGST